MLSIGEFARLAGVSVRMLRHYDHLGLLTPERVDPWSGYRSYGVGQLERANRIVALKDLGFTLDQVGRMLDGGLSQEDVALLLRERREELRSQIAADRHRLAAVEARLRVIQKEIPMTEYIETALPELHVVQQTARIEEMSQIEAEIGYMFTRVNEAIAAAGAAHTGPGVAIYTTDGDGMIAAAAEQIGDAATPAGLERATVPAASRALTGRYEADDLLGIQRAWQDIVAEIDRRGLTPAGPAREVYLETPMDPGGTRWVVDLQQQVA